MQEQISVKLFSDVGMGEVFMARLMHVRNHILSGVYGLENRQEIEDSIMRVIFDGLEPAFRSLREVRKEWVDDKVPEKRKRQHIENVYTYLTIAFKDRFQQTAKEFGYEIGFIFQKDSTFKKGAQEFILRHPKIGNDLFQLAQDDRATWLSRMIAVRNIAIDHAGDKGREEVEEMEKRLTPEDAETIFDNCWRAIEDTIIIFVLDKYDEKYGHQLLELAQYRADKNHHERFGWFLIPDHPANRGNSIEL